MGMPGWQPDWSILYSTGRCKFHWISWTAEEVKQIAESEDKQETINKLRGEYIDTHKAEIVDPNFKKRRDEKEWQALAEEYEILYGKKPHRFTWIDTLKKKIAEKTAESQ